MILVWFQRERAVSRSESHVHAGHFQAGESAAFLKSLAAEPLLAAREVVEA